MTKPCDAAALMEPSIGFGTEKIEANGAPKTEPPKWHQLEPTSRSPFRPHFRGAKTGPIFGDQKNGAPKRAKNAFRAFKVSVPRGCY